MNAIASIKYFISAFVIASQISKGRRVNQKKKKWNCVKLVQVGVARKIHQASRYVTICSDATMVSAPPVIVLEQMNLPQTVSVSIVASKKKTAL